VTVSVVPGQYAIARFSPNAKIPRDAFSGRGFVSVTRTAEEISVVYETACAGGLRPDSIEAGWSLVKLEGPLDFSLTGVLESLAAPLAKASISIFAVSTFDTDYVLVKEAERERALEALSLAGFEIGRD